MDWYVWGQLVVTGVPLSQALNSSLSGAVKDALVQHLAFVGGEAPSPADVGIVSMTDTNTTQSCVLQVRTVVAVEV